VPSRPDRATEPAGGVRSDWPEGITLAGLHETLGSLVVHIETAPNGTGVLVGEPVVHDVGEPVPDEIDGVLLLVGGAPENPETIRAVEQAGAARYCAVIVKARGQELAAISAAASAAGIALLVAPDDMPWRQLDALVTAATTASGGAHATYATVGIGDLFALANAIAYNVGGAVTIEDPRGHVLAYSNLPHQEIDEIRRQGILGRQTPDRPTNSAEYQRVYQAEHAVRFTTSVRGHTNRLAIAVRAGPQLLGLLWVLDGSPPLTEGAAERLEEASKIAALHLLRARRNRDPDRSIRAEVLSSLLDANTSGAVAATQLGIAVDTPTTVLAIAQAEPDETPGLGSARIVDLVGLYCEAWHPQALCTIAGGVVYALIPVSEDAGARRRVVKFARDVAATVQRSAGVAVHVAAADPAARLDDVASSRRLADRVLRALASNGPDVQVGTVDDVRSRVALLELADRVGTGIAMPEPVRLMIEHDRQHSTSYAQSLLAFLDSFGEAARGAAELAVHENTLRYRIRRLQELFGLDLDDPDTRLVTWLHLRLHQLIE
jgi:sugar diacid utilization regulator